MATRPTVADSADPVVQIDPNELEFGLANLVEAYQGSRSSLRAWLVVRYAEALCRHPEYEGSDEQRCAYRRLAKQWRWLATATQPSHSLGAAS